MKAAHRRRRAASIVVVDVCLAQSIREPDFKRWVSRVQVCGEKLALGLKGGI